MNKEANLKCDVASDRQQVAKIYDLEDRRFELAKRVRVFVKGLPRTLCNWDDVRQLVRSSRSAGANYLEANEALGKKGLPDANSHLSKRSPGIAVRG
jgi:hypothetical protein